MKILIALIIIASIAIAQAPETGNAAIIEKVAALGNVSEVLEYTFRNDDAALAAYFRGRKEAAREILGWLQP